MADDLRRQEENPTQPSFAHENLGAPKPQSEQPQPYENVEPAGQEGGHRLRDEAQDRAKEAAKDKIKERVSPSAKTPGAGASTGTEAAAGAGAEGAGAGAASAGAGAGTAAAGAGAEAGAAAGAAGAGAGAGAVATGAAGAAGAGAAGAGAAGAGAAGAGAAAGAAGAAGASAGASLAAAGSAAAGAAGATAAGAGAAASASTGVGVVVAIPIVLGLAIKYRREVLVALLILGVTGLLFLILLLGIFKPVASTLQVTSKFMGPLQQIVDERTVSILAKFTMHASEAIGSTDSSHRDTLAANGKGHVLAATTEAPVTQGKLKTLFDAMKANHFEARLKDKYGLELKAGNNGVQFVQYGKTIGQAHNATEAQSILSNHFPDIQRLLSEDVNGWSWAQHVKGARNLKKEYTMALAVPNAQSARSPADLTGVVKYQFTTILRTGLNNMQRGISCFTGGTNCNEDGAQVEGQAVPDYQTDDRSSLTATTKTVYDDNLKNISAKNNYSSPRLNDSVNQKIGQQVETKAVGLLGWLDIAATTQAMSEQNGAQNLPSLMRAKDAGALFLWNVSSINQQLGKDMSSDASTLVTRSFKDIESSQAFGYVSYNDTSRGTGLRESQKVQSKLQKPYQYIYQAMIKENPLITGTIGTVLKGWLIIHNSFVGTIIDFAASTGLGNVLNRIGAWVLDKIGVLPLVGNIVGMSAQSMLPICGDPADKSYNFYNCMATGADVSAQSLCTKYFGCGKTTLAQDVELKTASQQDMNARLAALPLERRLFDRTIPNSFINVAAMNSPIPMKATDNVASLFQSVFGAVWSAPSKVAALSAAPAHAANADSSAIDGVDHYGIPLETLQKTPLSDQLSANNGACPQTKPGELNMCTADMSTVDSLIARYTNNPAYGG